MAAEREPGSGDIGSGREPLDPGLLKLSGLNIKYYRLKIKNTINYLHIYNIKNFNLKLSKILI